jgi:hypothetical protein
MAKSKSTANQFTPRPRVKRGVHSKSDSFLKTSKKYKKVYNKQGR